VLPTTGGVGSQYYIFGGLLLLIAGLLYGYSRRCNKERRVGY